MPRERQEYIMVVISLSGIEETLDSVLQQQLISSKFRIFDRKASKTISVRGTKAVYNAIKETILAGFRASEPNDWDGFMKFCQERFQVPKKKFDDKLAYVPKDDESVDERLKFIMITSAVRDHWQIMAYETVLGEIARNLHGRGHNITREELDTILPDHFEPGFSHMINLYEIRIWSQLTAIPLRIRSPRLTILNKLTANIVKKLDSQAH